jgi:hypothetical protein
MLENPKHLMAKEPSRVGGLFYYCYLTTTGSITCPGGRLRLLGALTLHLGVLRDGAEDCDARRGLLLRVERK